MCFIFCMQINIKVSASWHYRFDGSGQYVQSTLNRKFLILLQYIKKNVSQLLLCSIVMQNIQILYGDPVMFVVTYCARNSRC